MHLRIQRYYRNKDAKNNFLEEDTDTLTFRNCTDAIALIHQDNFCSYSNILLQQNDLNGALSKINEGLDKIDHRHFEANVVKVKILKAMNKYTQGWQILENLISWYPEN